MISYEELITWFTKEMKDNMEVAALVAKQGMIEAADRLMHKAETYNDVVMMLEIKMLRSQQNESPNV